VCVGGEKGVVSFSKGSGAASFRSDKRLAKARATICKVRKKVNGIPTSNTVLKKKKQRGKKKEM